VEKPVVRKIMTGNGLNRKFDKTGTFNSTFATKGVKINHIKGTGTYSKARGYFKKFRVILADRNIVERNVSCQKMNFKENGKVEVGNFIYTLK
tara:strand:- start:433 stop:711 length:279 start_codon:yes stop_codon:yes gene_type:complete